MASVLSDKHFHDEAAAFAWVEARLWPAGPVCPHCQGMERIGKMGGKSTRLGTYKCYACRKPFTCRVGTVFESSHVPMHLWLQAMFLMTSSKKGISSNQLHRTLGVTLKTAWFMSHRIRLAMQAVGLAPMGGPNKIVEADETYIGKQEAAPKGAGGPAWKNAVMTLVERNGMARSFVIDGATTFNLKTVLEANLSRDTHLMTDEYRGYIAPGKGFASHDTVRHAAKEYVRGNVHTNTVEGYYSVFKRGMKGVYQHCKERHLHRYLAEFDFRYSYRVKLGVNDAERCDLAVKGVVGKRLTYKSHACA